MGGSTTCVKLNGDKVGKLIGEGGDKWKTVAV